MAILKTLARFALFALVLALLALVVPGEIAAQFACDLEPGATTPCRVAGSDMGPLLRDINANGWMAILAAEAAIAVLLLYVFVRIVRRMGGAA